MTDGFLNVLKPPGMSSHDVIGFVRKVFKIKKVGHAGTLDPGAAGVLPVAAPPVRRKKSLLYSSQPATASINTMGRRIDAASVTLMPPGFVR